MHTVTGHVSVGDVWWRPDDKRGIAHIEVNTGGELHGTLLVNKEQEPKSGVRLGKLGSRLHQSLSRFSGAR